MELKEKLEIVVMVNDYPGSLSDELEKIGIPIVRASYSWWYIQPRKNIIKKVYHRIYDTRQYRRNWLTNELLVTLQQYSFDFVYTNTSTVDAGAIISEYLGVPHYWHVREFGIEDFGFVPIVEDEVYERAFNNAEKIIVISDALRAKYMKIVPSDKIVKIYNGFDIDRLTGTSPKQISGHMNVLITGQVCEGKGQQQAIEAIQKLQNNGLDIDLYIAGSVNEEYLKPIIKRLRGDTSWLHVLGMCEDMFALRNRMHAELICSRSEAFGRVTLEAMLHGVAVIGSDRGCNPELITNEKTGLIYQYGNIDDLARCIKRIYLDIELRLSVIENAKKFASSFTIERTANELYSVFQR